MTSPPEDAVPLTPLFSARDGDRPVAAGETIRTVRPYLIEHEAHVARLLGRPRRPVESWPELVLDAELDDEGLRLHARLYLPPGAPADLTPRLEFDLGVDPATMKLLPAPPAASRPAPAWHGSHRAPGQRFLPADVRLTVGGAG